MIDFIRGKVAYIESDYVVVDVQGVGYRVFCANPYVFQKTDGQEVTVYIHHHVREDAILLYGFQTREEQDLFRRLLDVSGIGPRVALGILSGGRPETVIAAIQQENIAFLTKLPGIGKKTAQRMVLDLKDKLGTIAAGRFAASEAAPSGGAEEELRRPESVWSEAREALLALGYTEAEAEQAWRQVKTKVRDSDSVDAVTKLALQALFKG